MNNKKQLKLLEKIAVKVEALADTYAAMTDARLKECTSLFKARLESGESLDSVLPEAFAVVREAAKRVLNMYHFHVQVLGGIALHQGRICQMSTGEGKTLVSTMPAYLNALTGRGVHIVTVNEYLARRDSEWMGKIFKFLGLSVGVIYNDMPLKEKQRAYACDITYGTNNEFGFDYLRDNMAVSKSQLVQRGLNFAIVDEVDSILIDEARTPLIISGRSGKSNEMYITANRFVKTLTCGIEKSDEGKGKLASVMGEGYNEEDEEKYDAMKNEKDKAVRLTARGVAKAERFFKVDNLGDVESTELNHYINQALKAVFVMKRDDDYIVDKGEVKIVDEFTGRIMEGRRYNQGLHQAIEAKENVRIQEENKTLATITFQNLFRMYKKLSGMTGTAKTEEAEFNDIYNLDVVEIPTNKPMIRKDYDDVLYSTREAKLRNLVADIVERHKSGQPMLIGTVSVEKSEELSAMLKKKGVAHNVLNAKNNAREAEIVAQAGRLNAVTIATNMAGRGTDILLGGNPEYLAKQEMERNNYTHEQIETATSYADGDGETERLKAVYRALFDKYKAVCDAEKEKVLETGGLHIIGTERHESRRIDNQLRGRSGRQGDPGSSVFFLSTEDDLARVFGGERMQAVMQFFKLEEDVPIEAKIITRQIERAQKSIEGIHYSQRKHVLQYDEVNNKQRQVIYGDRNKVLNGEDVHGMILDMAAGFARKALEDACDGTENSRLWNLDAVSGI
ncbi:MAG: preprotein translocase subunit SecA, partial [Lachnospiraceae bacterium]